METGTAITENDRATAIIESLDQAAIVLDEEGLGDTWGLNDNPSPAPTSQA